MKPTQPMKQIQPMKQTKQIRQIQPIQPIQLIQPIQPIRLFLFHNLQRNFKNFNMFKKLSAMLSKQSAIPFCTFAVFCRSLFFHSYFRISSAFGSCVVFIISCRFVPTSLDMYCLSCGKLTTFLFLRSLESTSQSFLCSMRMSQQWFMVKWKFRSTSSLSSLIPWSQFQSHSLTMLCSFYFANSSRLSLKNKKNSKFLGWNLVFLKALVKL